MSKLLIKNGTVVNAHQTLKADVFIENGKISDVATDLKVLDKNITTIDATDKYVLPGGIDPHVHLHLPTFAGYSCDDFYSGTRAALAGGTTTIIDFVTPISRNESLLLALDKRKKEAETSLCNYAFHMSPLAWKKSVAMEIEQCISNEGIPSFKTYMAYKDSVGLGLDDIKSIMRQLNTNNGTLLVHAEDGDIVTKLQAKFLSEVKNKNFHHALSRPAEVEEKAVNELISLIKQTKCKTYIVHTSSGNSLGLIQQAQQNGLPIYAETCPQYLMFDSSILDQPFYESAPYVFSPALHSKEHKELLWKGLSKEIISTVGTDHCPFNLHGQKDLGLNDFTKVANGAGGIEHRLELLYTFGVLSGRISIQQFVNLISYQPAKIFGLNTKGAISKNFDADVVIWNPKAEKVITAKKQWQNCDHSIYEGINVKGGTEQTIINGKILYSKEHGFTNTTGEYVYRSI